MNPTAYRLATEEHLAQSEAFLTLFRASLERPGDHRLASATARQLLAGNRLLMALAHGFGHHVTSFGNPAHCSDGVLTGLT